MTTNTENTPATGKEAHTPTPWGVSSSTMLVAINDERDMPIIGNLLDLMGVSSIGIEEARANAAFIVTACNAYAAQQARIKELEEALKRLLRHPIGVSTSSFDIAQARAALPKSTEAAQ